MDHTGGREMVSVSEVVSWKHEKDIWPLVVGASYAVLVLLLWIPLSFAYHRYYGHVVYRDEFIPFIVFFVLGTILLSFMIVQKNRIRGTEKNTPLLSKYLCIGGLVHTILGGSQLLVYSTTRGYFFMVDPDLGTSLFTNLPLSLVPMEQIRFDIVEPFGEWSLFYITCLFIFMGIAFSLIGLFLEDGNRSGRAVNILGILIPLLIPLHLVLYIDSAVTHSSTGVLYATLAIPALCVLSGWVTYSSRRVRKH
ncbi:MAG: hypothetical protein R6U17_03265 [Thermoplasmata archaeon]